MRMLGILTQPKSHVSWRGLFPSANCMFFPDTPQTSPLLAVVHLSDEDDSDTAELAKQLISNGANVHQRSRGGKTALWIAVKRGLRATTKILIESGAKPCAKSANGTSILAAAYRRLRR